MNQEQLEKAKKLFFILLSVDIVINAIAGFNSFATVEILKNIQSGTRSLDQSLINSVDFWDKFSMLTILTLIGVGLGLVKWLNSCYGFAKESIGATGFKNEKWTVAGWIIPIFNLFKPYQVINEIYKAGSQNYSKADDWKKENGSWLLLTWWIFWAVTHFFMWIFGKEILKKSLRGDLTLPQVIGLYEIQAWLFVFSILVAALWFIVAGNLTQRFLNRSTKTSGNTVSVDDDHSYKTAYEEMSSGEFETATWAKAFAFAEGNQDKAKALYIKYRVEQLTNSVVEKSQVIPIKKNLDQPKINILEKNVWIFAIVGVFGVWLLISQLNKPSTKPQSVAQTQTQPAQPQISSPVIPAETHYHDNGNGTITDLQTDLQWARCSLGQEWKDNTCSGVANTYKWEAAKNELITLKNKGDWRIPSVEELRTLVYCSSGQPTIWNNTGDKCQGNYNSPTIDSVIFPNTPVWAFWSSSNSVYGSSHAWIVHFGKGESDTYDKEIGGIHVRLVRGGKTAKKFEETLKKANAGDANAQNEVGVIYFKGQGVAQDDIEAVKWFRKAADQSQANAQFNLGSMYATGRGILKNDVEAIQWCRLAAEQGLVNAQNMMGNMYSIGRGVPKNQAEAIKWYRLAAEQGLADAQNNLGSMYSYGNGVPKNQAEAIKWYRLAAEQGLADAQVNMAAMYANGNGVPKNDAEAIKWLGHAAEQGNATAQYSLGFMYNNGRGVSKNDIEAVKWFRQAAEQGNSEAQNSLGLMYGNGNGVPQNYAEAMDWFRKAAKQEYAPAQYNIGYFYEEGLGVSKNFDGAIRCIKKF